MFKITACLRAAGEESCSAVLKALAASDACSGARLAPECEVSERGTKHTGASVVLSNELLDAFAPVKLQLSIYGQPVITHCRAWQEIRLVHIIKWKELRAISEALQHSKDRIEAMALDLEGYTEEVFCHVTRTSVGQAISSHFKAYCARGGHGLCTQQPELLSHAMCSPGSCLAMVIGLTEIMSGLPFRCR